MSSPRYCFDKKHLPDFQSLVGSFVGKSLRSPYRSTVPLLSMIEHHRAQWEAMVESWGCNGAATVHLEYCVPSPKPDGNPSQTDAMVIGQTGIWAVEAKWTEPRDLKTVAKRIAKPEEDGGDPRSTVQGWLQHLQFYAARDLKLEDFLEHPYQTVHRAASACAVAREKGVRPEVVYLHFHPSPLKNSATTAMYVQDLERFHALLGRPDGLGFRVVDISLHPTPAFDAIKNLDKSSPASSAKVVAALCDGPLFAFGSPTTKQIGG